MNRPVDQRPGFVFGGRTSAALSQKDHALAVLPEGAQLTSITQIRCECGQIVARTLFLVGQGAAPQFVAAVQAIDRLEPRPVRVQLLRVRVRPGQPLLADCTAHGRITLDGDRVIGDARGVMTRIGAGRQRMGRFTAKPDGLPVGHDLDDEGLMTLEEAEAWLRRRQRGS